MLYVYQEKNIKIDIPKIANKFAKTRQKNNLVY